MNISMVAAVVIGFAGAGLAGAEEQASAAGRRAGVVKSSVRSAAKPARPKVATQKLMRYPWEKPSPALALANGRSEPRDEELPNGRSEELPYFYW